MSHIKCPNCEEPQDANDWADIWGSEGDGFVIDCPDCGTHFKVVTSVTVHHKAERILTGNYFCIETLKKTKGTNVLLLDKNCPDDFEMILRAEAMAESGYMQRLQCRGSVSYFRITDRGKWVLSSYE